MARELSSGQRRIGWLLTTVAGVFIVIAAVLAYQAREDADAERNYQACLDREREAFDNGERLIQPEDYCDTMLDR